MSTKITKPSGRPPRRKTEPRAPSEVGRQRQSLKWSLISLGLAGAIGFLAINRADEKMAMLVPGLDSQLLVIRSIIPAALAATSVALLFAGFGNGTLHLKGLGLELKGRDSLVAIWLAVFAALIGAAALGSKFAGF